MLISLGSEANGVQAYLHRVSFEVDSLQIRCGAGVLMESAADAFVGADSLQALELTSRSDVSQDEIMRCQSLVYVQVRFEDSEYNLVACRVGIERLDDLLYPMNTLS